MRASIRTPIRAVAKRRLKATTPADERRARAIIARYGQSACRWWPGFGAIELSIPRWMRSGIVIEINV